MAILSKKSYQKEIKKITEQIVKKYKPEKIILFGSFAYGRPKESSDIDLLLIKKTKERLPRRILKIAEIIKSPLGADVLVYTPKEWDEAMREENYFIREINQKGKLIYAK